MHFAFFQRRVQPFHFQLFYSVSLVLKAQISPNGMKSPVHQGERVEAVHFHVSHPCNAQNVRVDEIRVAARMQPHIHLHGMSPSSAPLLVAFLLEKILQHGQAFDPVSDQ